VGQLLVVVSCTNQHAQPELIPGLVSVLTGTRARWYVPNKLRTGAIALDLGSVKRVRDCTGSGSLVRPWPLYAYTGLMISCCLNVDKIPRQWRVRLGWAVHCASTLRLQASSVKL